METIQRKAALLLCAVLAAGIGLPGCSTHSEHPGTYGTDTQEQEVTLKLYFPGDKKSAMGEVWSAVSSHVKEKGLNVKFDIRFIPLGDFKEKMLVMAASGDTWDMNFDGDWLSFNPMAAKGAYLALNELLPQYAPNLFARYQGQGTLGAASVNGQIVGLPWTIKMNQRQFAQWRSDLTEKAGINPAPGSLQTIEDVDQFLHQMKQAYPNERITRVGARAVYELRDEWVDLGFHHLGFYLHDPKVTVKAMEQQPFYKEAAAMTKKWYDDGIMNRDAMMDKEDGAAQWRNGKALFGWNSHEWIHANQGFSDPSYATQSSQLYPDRKFINRTPLANVVAINQNSRHPERVLRFLDMLETDKALYDLVQYGIEGKTYMIRNDRVVYPEGMKNTTSNYMEWGGQWALWKPQFMRANPAYDQDFWTKEAEFASLPNNVDSPVDGLFITEDNIKSFLVKRDQAIEEFDKPIIFGMVKDVDKAVGSYIELQKSNGLDPVIADVQRQIDAFLAAKK
ncbi:extracellular solute-binding protein [Paenibacillus filicis]|uniref:Extracellular solute-binding protein n=1 Tax=Paenibacillus filicis TaxID=669464 RepID=A0ABU9DMC7_9BACL